MAISLDLAGKQKHTVVLVKLRESKAYIFSRQRATSGIIAFSKTLCRLASKAFIGGKVVLKLIAELAKVLLICLIIFGVTMFILTDPFGIAAPHSDTLPRQATHSILC